jgi:hypothetical protein
MDRRPKFDRYFAALWLFIFFGSWSIPALEEIGVTRRISSTVLIICALFGVLLGINFFLKNFKNWFKN